MFRTRFKKEIVAEFLPPARALKRQRVIILCDGMPSIPRKQALVEFLAAKGFWVVYPRYRGAWESGGGHLHFIKADQPLNQEKVYEIIARNVDKTVDVIMHDR